MSRQPVLIIVGQTAVGKTALSLELAQRFGGEIVSVDSRLFYRGMDIGTAKPSSVEQARVPHHLIDLCAPNETMSLGDFQQLAYHTIDDILGRGRLPILVGGTGQYVMAVIEGWGIPEVSPHPPLRRALEALPPGEAARWLVALDPQAAERNDLRNVRRVVRALEVIFVTGRRMSDLQRKTPPPYDFHLIGLTRDRAELYDRIDARVNAMMIGGLLAEVEALRTAGYDRRLPAMSGLGYRQLLAYLDGKTSLGEAVDQIKFDTHRFARKQGAWFRETDERIHWFDLTTMPNPSAAVTQHVATWLSSNSWLTGADV